LGGRLKIIARPLSGNLTIKFSFRVLLASLIGLVNGDSDKLRTEHGDNLGMGKCRRTVEYTVVSRTPQWVPIHCPNKNRFLFGDRLPLGIKQ